MTFCFALIASLSLLAATSHAELLDRGQYTEDTATGLKWLDATLIQGMSHDQAENEFGV